MWFTISRNLSCQNNIWKLANSRILSARIAQIITTPHTSPTKASICSAAVPYNHFQGWPKKRLIPSKGVLQQKPCTITKNTQVAVNYKGDQKPIAKRTRSRIDSTIALNIQVLHTLNEPIVLRTRPITLSQKYNTSSYSRALAVQLLTHVANPVFNQDTGKQMNYGQLRKHPKFQETWNKYFSN